MQNAGTKCNQHHLDCYSRTKQEAEKLVLGASAAKQAHIQTEDQMTAVVPEIGLEQRQPLRSCILR